MSTFATLASLVASPLWISFVKPAIFFPPMLSLESKSDWLNAKINPQNRIALSEMWRWFATWTQFPSARFSTSPRHAKPLSPKRSKKTKPPLQKHPSAPTSAAFWPAASSASHPEEARRAASPPSPHHLSLHHSNQPSPAEQHAEPAEPPPAAEESEA